MCWMEIWVWCEKTDAICSLLVHWLFLQIKGNVVKHTLNHWTMVFKSSTITLTAKEIKHIMWKCRQTQVNPTALTAGNAFKYVFPWNHRLKCLTKPLYWSFHVSFLSQPWVNQTLIKRLLRVTVEEDMKNPLFCLSLLPGEWDRNSTWASLAAGYEKLAQGFGSHVHQRGLIEQTSPE